VRCRGIVLFAAHTSHRRCAVWLRALINATTWGTSARQCSSHQVYICVCMYVCLWDDDMCDDAYDNVCLCVCMCVCVCVWWWWYVCDDDDDNLCVCTWLRLMYFPNAVDGSYPNCEHRYDYLPLVLLTTSFDLVVRAASPWHDAWCIISFVRYLMSAWHTRGFLLAIALIVFTINLTFTSSHPKVYPASVFKSVIPTFELHRLQLHSICMFIVGIHCTASRSDISGTGVNWSTSFPTWDGFTRDERSKATSLQAQLLALNLKLEKLQVCFLMQPHLSDRANISSNNSL